MITGPRTDAAPASDDASAAALRVGRCRQPVVGRCHVPEPDVPHADNVEPRGPRAAVAAPTLPTAATARARHAPPAPQRRRSPTVAVLADRSPIVPAPASPASPALPAAAAAAAATAATGPHHDAGSVPQPQPSGPVGRDTAVAGRPTGATTPPSDAPTREHGINLPTDIILYVLIMKHTINLVFVINGICTYRTTHICTLYRTRKI